MPRHIDERLTAVRLEPSSDSWDSIVLSLDLPHLLQSRVWGELKGRWGWKSHRLVWSSPAAPVAAAQVLSRRVGRLPISVPRNVGQLPVYYNAKPDARRKYVEGSASPLYCFGHGLSYTRFEYANVRASVVEDASGVNASVGADVTNVGARAGDEVVQVYLRDEVASVTTPERALKAFARVRLEPKETKRVEFKLGAADLALLNRSMQWVVEPGTFEVMFGASCMDVRQKVKIEVKKEMTLGE